MSAGPSYEKGTLIVVVADLISAQMTLLPSAFNLPVTSQDGGKPIAPGIVWEEVLQAH